MSEIRIGIVGTGRIAKRAVKEIAFVKELSISAVYNPNPEHAGEFVLACFGEDNTDDKESPMPECYGDYQEFLEQVDAVYIATPHGTHFDYAEAALDAGKHVLCEKPMTLNEEECRELFALASEKGLVLMEALKTEHCPGFKKLIKIAGSGVIGDIVDVEAAFTRLTEGNLREFFDIKNGGAFTEFGSYCLLPIFKLLGTEYKDISFYSIPCETGVDGYSRVVLEFEKSFGTAKCGLTVKSEGQLLVSGTKGYIIAPSPWWLTKYFEVRFEDPKKIKRYNFEFEGDGLRYEFWEFAERIRNAALGKNVLYGEEEAAARAGVFEKMLERRRG